MRTIIISIILLSTIGIIPIDDGGGSSRMFHSIEITPYDKDSSFSLAINYHSPNLEPTIIEVSITNTKFDQQLIYAQSINLTGNFSTVITIFPYMVDDIFSIFHFDAYGNEFFVAQELKIYPKQNYIIDQFFIEEEQSFNSGVSKSIITNNGISQYHYEQISFINFNGYIEHEYYLRLEIERLKIHLEEYGSNSLNFLSGNLYVEDKTNNFPLLNHNDDWAILPLKTIKEDDYWHIDFANDLYVEPRLLLISHQNYQDFIPSRYIYLPNNRFEQLKIINMKISLLFEIGHTYQIDYHFQYFANRRFIGNCSNSMFCVDTIENPLDVGYQQWQEITND